MNSPSAAGAASTVNSPEAPGPAAPPSAQARATRTWVVGAVLALIALGLAWELWLAPTGSGTLAIKVLPLLPALPGLWRYRLYTYRWLSLLVWIYVCEGLVRAPSERGWSQGLAVLEVVLSLIIFIGCVIHVRGRLRQAQPA